MTTRTRLRFGALLHGAGGAVAGWRHPDAVADGAVDFELYRRWVRAAEDGRFDLVFITDTLYITPESTPQYLSQFEPLTLLGALAAASSAIGLVATVSTSYSEPFTVARQLATIDHISGGRAGVNVVTSAPAGTALNFGQAEEQHPEHDTRYRKAAEYLDVVRGLWDSWEDDALVRDKPAGVFFDPAKLHILDHRGEFFAVKGPLNIERSPQGWPVVFQAGSSEAGKTFATREAECVFLGPHSREKATELTADLRRRAAAAGRPENIPLVFVAVTVFLGPTEAEAERVYQEIAGLSSTDHALRYLSLIFGQHDFTGYDLDEPFPELGEIGRDAFQAGSEKIRRTARENGWTLRQTALEAVTPRGEFIGTPEQVADRMQEWFEAGATDGFMLLEAVPGGLETFVEQVVPILRKRGLAATEYESRTLRGHLGLPVPRNRFVSPEGDDPIARTRVAPADNATSENDATSEVDATGDDAASGRDGHGTAGLLTGSPSRPTANRNGDAGDH